MVVGPKDDGSFCDAIVHSLRRNRIPCRMVYAGQVASIGLSQEGSFPVRKVCPCFCCMYEEMMAAIYLGNNGAVSITHQQRIFLLFGV